MIPGPKAWYSSSDEPSVSSKTRDRPCDERIDKSLSFSSGLVCSWTVGSVVAARDDIRLWHGMSTDSEPWVMFHMDSALSFKKSLIQLALRQVSRSGIGLKRTYIAKFRLLRWLLVIRMTMAAPLPGRLTLINVNWVDNTLSDRLPEIPYQARGIICYFFKLFKWTVNLD